jgi:hypothetical protein
MVGKTPQPRSSTFLNWMLSNETQDDGEAEDIQETAEAAFAASSLAGAALFLTFCAIGPKLISKGSFSAFRKPDSPRIASDLFTVPQ